MSTELRTVATHPTVQLHFLHDYQAWHFARYYQAVQAQSEEPLSLLDIIEEYRCRPRKVNL